MQWDSPKAPQSKTAKDSLGLQDRIWPKGATSSTEKSSLLSLRLCTETPFPARGEKPRLSDLLRFLIGGICVSIFALIADVLKPKSFAGLFGAAPSVALATLALTIHKNGVHYAALEARSMLAGAAALLIYCMVVTWILKRDHMRALAATSSAVIVWFAASFSLWYAFLR